MKSNNKEFYVYITGKESSIIEKDNYQVIYGFEYFFRYPGLIDIYYDGTTYIM